MCSSASPRDQCRSSRSHPSRPRSRSRAAASSRRRRRESSATCNDVRRSSLRLQEDQPDVFADDAQAEELDRRHEQDDHDRAGPAAGRRPAGPGVEEDPDQQHKRQRDRGQAQVRDQPQGVAAEADQPVDRQARRGPGGCISTVRPRGRRARRPSRPGGNPTNVRRPRTNRLRSGRCLEGVDDLAVHQAEIAAVERDVQVADRVQKPVERGVAQPLEQALPCDAGGRRRRRRNHRARRRGSRGITSGGSWRSPSITTTAWPRA